MEADLKERVVLLRDYQPEVISTLVILDIQCFGVWLVGLTIQTIINIWL